MAAIRSAAQYQGQLRSLLPSGPAWDPERVPELE
ncbi:MAG: phage tail protein, partial [Pseudomonas protegens]